MIWNFFQLEGLLEGLLGYFVIRHRICKPCTTVKDTL